MIVFMGVSVGISYVADSVYSYTLQKAGHLSIFSMRSDLYRHILTLPRHYFDQNPVGKILTRVTSDMEALGESLAVGALNILTDMIKTLALLSFLIYLSWKLTLLIFLILPPIYWVSVFLRNRLRWYYNSSREALAEATGYLQECLNGIKTIQFYAAEQKVQQQYREKTQKFFHAQSRSNFYDATLFSVIEGITSIALALLIWYGAHEIMTGLVSVGVLVGFINTMQRIFIPIREFTQQISVFQRALASLENIDALFRENSEKEEGTLHLEQLEQLRTFNNLQFDQVYFRYKKDGPYILKGVSFVLNKGERIAFVGATGSGKSTIIRLLTRMYTDYKGSITINGIELSRIPRKILNQLFSLMQQDTYLFEESVGFNIALNRPALEHKDIAQAAHYVYADTFIEQWEEKYDYLILENGKNVSAGQAQLIAFARAIANQSDVMILDEATSAVDSVTEHLIEKAIEKVFSEKTVIAIAHRLSTIRKSDTILVMKEGEIQERGTHETLIVQQGIYAGLLEVLEHEEVNDPKLRT
jgi:ATP-binding cassette, subfamily B, multidrug efflux pump